jgi:2-C-methyl-D-erythritol 2,4-cyclodiphosphate synthase
MRIGHGYDIHRFSDDPTRALVLALVEVPDSRGLHGHSDADVATHALCDALLGAAHLGDLGRHFPDSDAQYRGIASGVLLTKVLELVQHAHFVPESADITIVAEVPKLAAFMDQMSNELSALLAVPVCVKATTNEGLGAIGRGEAISAHAVVLLKEIS